MKISENTKVRIRVPKRLYEAVQAEMQKHDMEEGMDHDMEEGEELEEASIVSDPNFIAGLATLLGVGGSLAASLVKDLRKAKTPEEKKAAKQKMASAIQGSMAGSMEEAEEVEEVAEAVDLETLMEAIKDAKKKKAEEKKKKEAEAKKKKEAEAKKKALAAKKK